MKTKLIAMAVAGAVLACGFPAISAVTTPVAGVVQANANGDSINSQLPYAAKITGVKVNPVTGGRYYQLRNTNSSGGIIYRTEGSATSSTMVLDQVRFVKPSGGLYFETNDTGATLTIYTAD